MTSPAEIQADLIEAESIRRLDGLRALRRAAEEAERRADALSRLERALRAAGDAGEARAA